MVNKACVDFEIISKLSNLMKYFLKAAEANQLSATVVGQQKHEVGLAIPMKYTAITNCKTMPTTLYNKLDRKNEQEPKVKVQLKLTSRLAFCRNSASVFVNAYLSASRGCVASFSNLFKWQ